MQHNAKHFALTKNMAHHFQNMSQFSVLCKLRYLKFFWKSAPWTAMTATGRSTRVFPAENSTARVCKISETNFLVWPPEQRGSPFAVIKTSPSPGSYMTQVERDLRAQSSIPIKKEELFSWSPHFIWHQYIIRSFHLTLKCLVYVDIWHELIFVLERASLLSLFVNVERSVIKKRRVILTKSFNSISLCV